VDAGIAGEECLVDEPKQEPQVLALKTSEMSPGTVTQCQQNVSIYVMVAILLVYQKYSHHMKSLHHSPQSDYFIIDKLF
jgi:hypothetical protein